MCKNNCKSCPFGNEPATAEYAGDCCLPSPVAIISMRVDFGRTWACHSNPKKPCLGAINMLKKLGLPYKIVNDWHKGLLTEESDWHKYYDNEKAPIYADLLAKGYAERSKEEYKAEGLKRCRQYKQRRAKKKMYKALEKQKQRFVDDQIFDS